MAHWLSDGRYYFSNGPAIFFERPTELAIKAFQEKYREARRIRAQKKIYFWIIPILYKPGSESSRRLAEASWKECQSFMNEFNLITQ